MAMNGKPVQTMLKIEILGVQFAQKKELTLDLQNESCRLKNLRCEKSW